MAKLSKSGCFSTKCIRIVIVTAVVFLLSITLFLHDQVHDIHNPVSEQLSPQDRARFSTIKRQLEIAEQEVASLKGASSQLEIAEQEIAGLKALSKQDNQSQQSTIEALKRKIDELTQEKNSVVVSAIDANAFDANDYDTVLERMEYWRTAQPAKLPTENDKYLMFKLDCGGFNNIRMAFEMNIIVAWLTRRTLVLPPPAGWYLIDFGPIKRGVPPEVEGEQVSIFADFFDMDDLAAGVPVLSTLEFIAREKDRLKVPEEFWKNSDDAPLNHGEREKWQTWLHATEFGVKMPWGNLNRYLAWPDNETVAKERPPSRTFIDGRTVVEYTREQKDSPMILFPSCYDGPPENDMMIYRYLGQVSSVAAFADRQLERSMRRMLRDNVHYVPLVFEVAARVVAQLGMFNFSSLHIRRNDLQYKEVFVTSQQTRDNINSLLNPGETVYVATDEVDNQFFQALCANNPCFFFQDFLEEKGGYVLKDMEIPHQNHGMIEQVICAMGRRFFGTKESTFSSYINRLRGYFDSPDKNTYYHNKFYTGDPATDKKHYPRVAGNEYKSEDPAMWEDLIDP